MNDPERRQERINAGRDYISIAAAGICFGAALTIFVPAGITSRVGLDHMDPMLAAKTALVAAAVWFVARLSRIKIRRR